jgi:hypothetical protein
MSSDQTSPPNYPKAADDGDTAHSKHVVVNEPAFKIASHLAAGALPEEIAKAYGMELPNVRPAG